MHGSPANSDCKPSTSASDIETEPFSIFPFLDLPRELRDQIYAVDFAAVPHLLDTCKQIRSETLQMWQGVHSRKQPLHAIIGGMDELFPVIRCANQLNLTNSPTQETPRPLLRIHIASFYGDMMSHIPVVVQLAWMQAPKEQKKPTFDFRFHYCGPGVNNKVGRFNKVGRSKEARLADFGRAVQNCGAETIETIALGLYRCHGWKGVPARKELVTPFKPRK